MCGALSCKYRIPNGVAIRVQRCRQQLPTRHLSAFACGEASLDDWLKRRALTNQLSGASRTFVGFDENRFVVGYYALAAGAVARESATGGVCRNMPDPHSGAGIGQAHSRAACARAQAGAALWQDAVLQGDGGPEDAGVRALLVHALNESAGLFKSTTVLGGPLWDHEADAAVAREERSGVRR